MAAGARPTPPGSRRSAGTPSRSTGTTSRRSTAFAEAGATNRRPTRSSPGRTRAGLTAVEDGRVPRQAARRPGRGARGARRAPEIAIEVRSPSGRASDRDRRRSAAPLRDGRGRHPPGIRRRARALGSRDPTSSSSTPRSRTRPSPRSSRRLTPTASSRCSSPSSRWSPPPSGCRRAATCPSPRPSPPSSTRAYDFVRMAAISRATFVLCGSHAGVSIGEDGPSQMGLEDIAMFRAVLDSDGALSVRREPDREARRADRGDQQGSRTCGRIRRTPR